MFKVNIAAITALVALGATPCAAQVFDIPLGVIVVPPTQTFTPGLTFANADENGANFEFLISQPMTLTASSFTNSSIGETGVFVFSSIGLYSGLGTAGALLQQGSIAVFGNTHLASLDQYSLDVGQYTIAYRGTVTGPPAGVGSNITFAAGAPMSGAPEPSTWALMILGFGAAGGAMRRRDKMRTSIRFT